MSPPLYLTHLDALRLGRGCQAKETQRRVALLKKTGSLKSIETLREFLLEIVFNDYHPLRGDKVRIVQELEHPRIIVDILVGRIDENKICNDVAACDLFQTGNSIRVNEFSIPDLERFQVLPHQLPRFRVRFHKNHLSGTAADCFDANGPRPCKYINEKRVFD